MLCYIYIFLVTTGIVFLTANLDYLSLVADEFRKYEAIFVLDELEDDILGSQAIKQQHLIWNWMDSHSHVDLLSMNWIFPKSFINDICACFH